MRAAVNYNYFLIPTLILSNYYIAKMNKYILILFTFCIAACSSCNDIKDVTFSGIENVQIISISTKGAEAEITAKIKNPNNMGFTVYKSDMDVTLNGINTGKAYLTDNVKIKRNSEEAYTFKVKADFSNLSLTDFPSLLAIATGKNIKVGLKGNIKAGNLFVKRTFPVDVSQDVPINK